MIRELGDHSSQTSTVTIRQSSKRPKRRSFLWGEFIYPTRCLILLPEYFKKTPPSDSGGSQKFVATRDKNRGKRLRILSDWDSGVGVSRKAHPECDSKK